jgi:hypothetical protein
MGDYIYSWGGQVFCPFLLASFSPLLNFKTLNCSSFIQINERGSY